MDMEHIKPNTMSTFRAILYSPPHLHTLFIDRHILMLIIVTYTQLWEAKYQKCRRILHERQILHSNTW